MKTNEPTAAQSYCVYDEIVSAILFARLHVHVGSKADLRFKKLIDEVRDIERNQSHLTPQPGA